MALDPRTENNLKGVHPDLVKVFRRAYQLADPKPTCTCGPRSLAEQKILLKKGATRTLRSRHIPASNGLSHAIDVAFIFGKAVRWDWPLYKTFADVMKKAARELSVPIEWGGDWRTFKDGPHFQLPWDKYPG
jgi:peptidoglycan L-alanyl-D-glutamate endopeptidase CwlK